MYSHSRVYAGSRKFSSSDVIVTKGLIQNMKPLPTMARSRCPLCLQIAVIWLITDDGNQKALLIER